MLPYLTLSLLASLTLVLLYKLILHPLFVSPLRRIPAAHPTARFSSLWILWVRYCERENRTVHAAHVRHGPIILLGPGEISVNCVDGGIRSVYGGNWEKDEWYAFFANYSVHNMFSSVNHAPHSARKRMLSHVYSKSYIQSSAAVRRISQILMHDRLLPLLKARSIEESPVNVYHFFNAATMDSITAFLYGIQCSTNRLEEPEANQAWLDMYWSRFPYRFFKQEIPGFSNFVRKIGLGLVPRTVTDADKTLEDWNYAMCEKASYVADEIDRGATVSPEDVPTVYSKLRAALEKEAESERSSDKEFSPGPIASKRAPVRLKLASELFDHMAAGFDTSGIVLTYAAWELSRNQKIQDQLRSELLGLRDPLVMSSASLLPDPQELDSLPLLHAITMETLRIHPAIPGAQPRSTPYPPTTIGGYPDIPGGIRVNAQAYSLHRNEAAFPHAGEWRPERWLGDMEGQTEKKERWFWAFGIGGRMCVGSNFAMHSNKTILAAIYTNFRTTIVDDSGIEQSDAYTAPPSGKSLILRFEYIER